MRALMTRERQCRRKVEFMLRYCSKMRPAQLVTLWVENRDSKWKAVRMFADWCWHKALSILGIMNKMQAEVEKILAALESWLKVADFREIRWLCKVDVLVAKRVKRKKKKTRNPTSHVTLMQIPPEELAVYLD